MEIRGMQTVGQFVFGHHQLQVGIRSQLQGA